MEVVFLFQLYFLWIGRLVKHKLSYLESTDDEVFSREKIKESSKEEIREEERLSFQSL